MSCGWKDWAPGEAEAHAKERAAEIERIKAELDADPLYAWDWRTGRLKSEVAPAPITGQCSIYLASRYSRCLELQGYAAQLTTAGHRVASRWHGGNHQADDLSSDNAVRYALEDLQDLRDANVLILFTEQPRSTNSRGGSMVELGIAIATNKRIFIIGPAANIFCTLPCITFVDGVENVIARLWA
jgi:hypothetical protein